MSPLDAMTAERDLYRKRWEEMAEQAAEAIRQRDDARAKASKLRRELKTIRARYGEDGR